MDNTKSEARFFSSRKISHNLSRIFSCITVTTQNISEIYGGYARALLTVNEVVDDNTPDYEIFDTLYLMLVVTDLNQEQGEDSASGNINVKMFDMDHL